MKRHIFASLCALGTLWAASGNAHAAGSVKLECHGNCYNVTVGAVCDTYLPNSQPVAIACDDTATPGTSFGSVPCGYGTCRPYGGLVRSDRVGDYCSDGSGNDVIVTCASSTPGGFIASGGDSEEKPASDGMEETEPRDESEAEQGEAGK
jgi:hypothetical protein